MGEKKVIGRMIVYTIKKNRVRYVSSAMREFAKEVRNKEPGTLVSFVFQKKDKPHEFVHFVVFKNKRAEKLHKSSKHAKRLLDIIYPNSSREPVFIDLNKVH